MSNSPHQPPSALTKLQTEYAERYGGSHTRPLQAPALEVTGVHGTQDLHDSCQTCNVSRAHGCEHLTPRSAGSVNPSAAIGANNGFTAQVPRPQYENPRPNYTRLDGPRPSTWTLSDEVLPPAAGGIGKGMEISPPMTFPHTTIFLQPIAAPQALGMAAWSATSFVFGAWLAEWYGTDATGMSIFPFFIFGGVAQFAAGMWSFRSRDTLASVVHTMWACFWLAIGFFYATRPAIAIAVPNQPNISTRWYNLQAFAIWMVPIAAFTWIAAMASLLRDMSQTVILSLMATGSTLTLIGWFSPSVAVTKIGAYFWLVGALLQLFRVFVYFLHENKKSHAEDGLLPRYHRRETHWRDDWRRGYASPYREPGVVHGDGWW